MGFFSKLGDIFKNVIGFIADPLGKRQSSPPPPPPVFVPPPIETIVRNITVRSPNSPRRMLYGQTRLGGTISFVSSTGATRFLHTVVLLGEGPIEAIDEVFLDEIPIYPEQLNAQGVVTSGQFANKVRIKKALGTDDQAVDPDLLAENPELTTDFRARGIAYVYVRLEFDQDVFPSKQPELSVYVRGRKLFDPRTSTTLFHSNAALVLRDYMTDSVLGLGVDAATEFDDTQLIAAANICDEFVAVNPVNFEVLNVVTASDVLENAGDKLFYQIGDRVQITSSGAIPGGLLALTNYFIIPLRRKSNDALTVAVQLAATYEDALAYVAIDITNTGTGSINLSKNAEPRYQTCGVVAVEQDPGTVIEQLLTSMAGTVSYANGLWRVLPGAFIPPTKDFTIADIVGQILVVPRHSRRERFNRVQGTFVSTLNNDQPSNYPLVSNAFFEAQDNGVMLPRSLNLPFTTRTQHAQRVAKIILDTHRLQLTASITLNLKGLGIQVGDTIRLTVERFGWSLKEFTVREWSLFQEGGGFAQSADKITAPVFTVRLTVAETASAAFDFNLGQETLVDVAPNSNLPDFRSVGIPTGVSARTISFLTPGGDTSSRLKLRWNPSADAYVESGGVAEVQFRTTVTTALDFDGVNDRVDVSNTAVLNPPGSFTLEVWIKPNTTQAASGTGAIISKDDATDGYAMLFVGQGVSGGDILFRTRGLSNVTLVASNVIPDDGAFHHVAVVFDTVGDTKTIYVDGVQQAQALTVTGSLTANTTDLVFGDNTISEFFGGVLDDLRLWNTTRSATQINNNKDIELNGTESGLAGYWQFNAGIGTTALDSSPFINDGLIAGAVYIEGKLVPAFEPSFSLPGSAIDGYIPQVQDGFSYDIRIRFVNNIGVRGPFTTLLGVLVGGTASGITSIDDLGLVTETVIDIDDLGLVTDPVTVIDDLGVII